MDKVERFNEVFEYIRGTGKAHNKEAFSDYLGYNNTNISKALNGKYPLGGVFKKILKLNPEINKDWLLTGEGSMLTGDLKDKQKATQSDPYTITKSGVKFRELPNGKYKIKVPTIYYAAYAKYVDECRDAEYVDELQETEFIVDDIPHGRYLSFEIKGESMNDGTINSIPDGAYILGRELHQEHWNNGNGLRINRYPYWIIVLDNTILCKEVVEHNTEKGTIKCHSLNQSPEYSDFELNIQDIRQLFNIIKKTF